jgi:hypothetical protein
MSQMLCQVLGCDELDGFLAVAHGGLVCVGHYGSDTLIDHSLTTVALFPFLWTAGSWQHLEYPIPSKCAI